MLSIGINRQATFNAGGTLAARIQDMFGGVHEGLYLDVSDSSTVSGSGGSTPSYGELVFSVADKSGNSNNVTFSGQPRYGRHPTSGLRNLINDSDNFVGASGTTPNFRGWQPFSGSTQITTSSAETSPQTNATVCRVFNDDDGGFISTVAFGANYHIRDAGTYTASVYYKTNGTGTKPTVDLVMAFAGLIATFDVSAGTVALSGSTAKHHSSSVTNAGNGWYLCKLSVDCVAADSTSSPVFLGVDASGSYVSFHGHTSEFFISAPQLELGTSRTAFQETASHYDVSQEGQDQVYYLSFEGAEYARIADMGLFGSNVSVLVGATCLTGTPKQSIVHFGDDTSIGMHVHVDASEIKNTAKGNNSGAITVETSDVGGQITFPLKSAIFAETQLSGSSTTITLGSQGHDGTSSSGLGGGSLSAQPLQIGASNTDSTADTFLKGRLYQLVVISKIPTAEEKTTASTIIDAKVGV